MKVVVIGATGTIGSRIADELESRGVEVVHAGRSNGVDVTQPASVATAVEGADAVVSAVKVRDDSYTLAGVARSLVDGLRRAGVRRLVIVGGAGSLEAAPGVRLVDTPEFEEEWKPEALDHADALAFFRTVDDLDWTFVSPAAYIHPGERTGRYRVGGDQLLVDENGKSEVSAEDYAIAIADVLEQASHPGERITVAW